MPSGDEVLVTLSVHIHTYIRAIVMISRKYDGDHVVHPPGAAIPEDFHQLLEGCIKDSHLLRRSA